MADWTMLIATTIFLVLLQSCTSVFVEEPKKIKLDLLQSIYNRKSLQTKIEEGVFGLPENIGRPDLHVSAKDELDCNIRYLAYNYSKKILSPSANLKVVADGLQLSSLCGITPKIDAQREYLEHEKKVLSIKAHNEFLEFFVDAAKGRTRKRKDGSYRAPFGKIEEALNACVTKRRNTNIHCIIRLRGGVHFIKNTVELTHKHSNVLITRYADRKQ